MKKSVNERFARFVQENPEGCWIWGGAKTQYGHGRFDWSEAGGYAHRASWVLNFGPIPEGMHVLHRCDNPPCVRPDHLFLGTHQANMADRDKKGRAVKLISPQVLAQMRVRAIMYGGF